MSGDLLYSSHNSEKCWLTYWIKKRKFSFVGCLLQAYFLHALGAAECYILTIMAYDRYLAICKPLQYSSIMVTRLYVSLVVACVIGGFISPVMEAILIISLLPYCGPQIIFE
ncbi:unnamed protein product [Staurois parvus]|uniref:G-protein coupled receptors family 1 profile domain-containing protein n=1 Tax=Staurois parvus TaxID=386267 RepID=A0ABN9CHP8_9NEOB|nr:unnamed protein product [Staurois parvus]